MATTTTTAFSVPQAVPTTPTTATSSQSPRRHRLSNRMLSLSTTASDAPTSNTPTPSPSSSDTTAAFTKPPRVIPDGELPTLYVYDHCPFCVRVRVALGLKNVKFHLRFLANDDVVTPTALIGKKMAPILKWEDTVMAESLDMIEFLEQDDRLGPTNLIAPFTGREDLKEWQASVRDLLRNLQRPRYVATGLLPEFQQLDGRHAFVQNHPLPGYSKEEWKENLNLGEKLKLYAELMAKDPASDIEELNRQLVELNDLLYSEYSCSPGGLSMDDVDLFSRLRSITIIQGVKWPKKLRKYMDTMATLSDVPLYDEMAL